MFTKKTVRDISLKGKQVLLRADYNVPVDHLGQITDNYRITQSLPTIEYLQKQGCKIVITSHLGRPDGKIDKSFSLAPVAKELGKLLKQKVGFVPDCVGPEVNQRTASLIAKEILVLENVRFHPEEEANDRKFAKQLVADSHADVFVQDAFGVVHHGAVSVSAIPKYLPGVAGLLVEKEVDTVTNVMQTPKRPLLCVIGGAKIADKIDIINRFIDIADFVAVGGAMANTFLLAEGVKIGKSLADKADVPLAKELLEKARAKAKKQPFVFYLPQDGVVATSLDRSAKTRIAEWQSPTIADIENYPKRPPHESSVVAANEMILDIGPSSAAFIAGAIQLSNTVIWNGTVGVAETVPLQGDVGPFAHGTEAIMEAMFGEHGHRPFSLVGGGDTAAYIDERHMTDRFSFVSTGGGASLELMAGKKLPGIEALLDKK